MADKILIADDDPDILRFVEINLRLEDFEIITAGDGEEALQNAIDERPDLVILDVMMPKMDGFEVCQRLRSDPRTAGVNIIMLTAKSLSAEKVVGLTAGADDYIIKPFDPLELVARVKSTLRRAREMRDVNPLTGLPGNAVIIQELQRRIASGLGYALMHVDADNFKAFNDHYGFARGDTVIKLLAKILQESAMVHDPEWGFVGHIGGDDFVMLCHSEVAEDCGKEALTRFDASIPALYDPSDAEKGYITVADRKDEPHDYPLMTVSIGVASSAVRPIESHWQASEIAVELKQYAKKQPGSYLAVDRRSNRGPA
ncbi:MAG: GGDEF domain-containing response regulator [Actinomycetota bacterium]